MGLFDFLKRERVTPQSEPRLKVRLVPGWSQLENPEGPATFIREASPESGALQFSDALYKSGRLPDATEEHLAGMCRDIAAKVPGGQVKLSHTGNCDFGLFATLAVRGVEPTHLQVWVLSNGRDFIFVTHTCMTEPDAAELSEANNIALMTRLGSTG